MSGVSTIKGAGAGAGAGVAARVPIAWSAITGLILSVGLILLAASLFGGQASRQTASSLAQARATLIADAAARSLSAEAGVARDANALVGETAELARVTELRQIRVVDTLARTVTILVAPDGAPQPAGSRAPITDAQKPLFDYALKARSDMPVEGFAAATGFVGSDGAGFGVQAVRANGADGVAVPVGMVEVQAARPDVGGGPGPIALAFCGLLVAGALLVVLTRGPRAAPVALVTTALV
nr:hypothetical protein [Hyphomonadaceae bacterium]